MSITSEYACELVVEAAGLIDEVRTGRIAAQPALTELTVLEAALQTAAARVDDPRVADDACRAAGDVHDCLADLEGPNALLWAS